MYRRPLLYLLILILCAAAFMLLACDPWCMGCDQVGFDPAPFPALYYFRP